jgi:hypothetical protein
MDPKFVSNFFIYYLVKLVCLKFSERIIATEDAIFKDLLLFTIGIFNLCLIEL